MHSWKVAYLRWQSSTHRLIQKKSSTHWFNSAWEKKKKTATFFSCQSCVWLCGYFPSPPTVNFLFFHNHLPSIFTLLFHFPLRSWDNCHSQIPNSYNRKQKSKTKSTSNFFTNVQSKTENKFNKKKKHI